ncbi:putative ribonuclease H-like domain-containing protein [Tanacetum coccineum]
MPESPNKKELQELDHDDSLMPELEIFHKPETGIFDEASYDEEGVITDFNSHLPHGMKVIGTKWVYRNKRDERGVVVRNKARLVAQGYTQEEVYQLGEKFGSKWLFFNGTIMKRFMSSQPPGFVDPDIQIRNIKVVKAFEWTNIKP